MYLILSALDSLLKCWNKPYSLCINYKYKHYACHIQQLYSTFEMYILSDCLNDEKLNINYYNTYNLLIII